MAAGSTRSLSLTLSLARSRNYKLPFWSCKMRGTRKYATLFSPSPQLCLLLCCSAARVRRKWERSAEQSTRVDWFGVKLRWSWSTTKRTVSEKERARARASEIDDTPLLPHLCTGSICNAPWRCETPHMWPAPPHLSLLFSLPLSLSVLLILLCSYLAPAALVESNRIYFALKA